MKLNYIELGILDTGNVNPEFFIFNFQQHGKTVHNFQVGQ